MTHPALKPVEMVKVRRGGECFWAEVLSRDEHGAVLRCDSQTADPNAPRYGEVFRGTATEDVFGWVQTIPRFRVVK